MIPDLSYDYNREGAGERRANIINWMKNKLCFFVPSTSPQAARSLAVPYQALPDGGVASPPPLAPARNAGPRVYVLSRKASRSLQHETDVYKPSAGARKGYPYMIMLGLPD